MTGIQSGSTNVVYEPYTGTSAGPTDPDPSDGADASTSEIEVADPESAAGATTDAEGGGASGAVDPAQMTPEEYEAWGAQQSTEYPGLVNKHVDFFIASGVSDAYLSALAAEGYSTQDIQAYIGQILANPEGWDYDNNNPAGTARQGILAAFPDAQLAPVGSAGPATASDRPEGTLVAPSKGFGSGVTLGGFGVLGLVAATIGFFAWKGRGGRAAAAVADAAAGAAGDGAPRLGFGSRLGRFMMGTPATPAPVSEVGGAVRHLTPAELSNSIFAGLAGDMSENRTSVWLAANGLPTGRKRLDELAITKATHQLPHSLQELVDLDVRLTLADADLIRARSGAAPRGAATAARSATASARDSV